MRFEYCRAIGRRVVCRAFALRLSCWIAFQHAAAGVAAGHLGGVILAKKSLVAIALVLAAFAPVAPPAASGRDVAGLNLYLRRATFDPLRSTPQISSAMRAGPSSRLAIAQFDAAPTGAT